MKKMQIKFRESSGMGYFDYTHCVIKETFIYDGLTHDKPKRRWWDFIKRPSQEHG